MSLLVLDLITDLERAGTIGDPLYNTNFLDVITFRRNNNVRATKQSIGTSGKDFDHVILRRSRRTSSFCPAWRTSTSGRPSPSALPRASAVSLVSLVLLLGHLAVVFLWVRGIVRVVRVTRAASGSGEG